MPPLPRNQLELDELSGVLVQGAQSRLVVRESAPLDLEERAHELLSFQSVPVGERGRVAALPGARRDQRRAAAGVNGSLKSRDRSLVIGGELQDVVAVCDRLFPQRPESLLISRHGGKFDAQERVELIQHAMAESKRHAGSCR